MATLDGVKAADKMLSWGSYMPPGMCLQAVSKALGSYYLTSDRPGYYQWAMRAWETAPAANRFSSRTPPKGAPVFFTAGANGYGHVALSMGGGKIVSTDVPYNGKIGVTTISALEKAWGRRYLGYTTKFMGHTITNAGSGGGGGSTPATSGLITHTVKKGESAWDIAHRWRMSKARLMRLNGMSTDKVKVGQKLKVDPQYSEPYGRGTQGTLKMQTYPYAIYTLKSGDTRSAVVKKFGMSHSRFDGLNPIASNGGWRHWPAGLNVRVAIDHAPKTYQYLDRGNKHTLATAQVQRKLGITADGIYGAGTEGAVVKHQRKTPGLGASGKVDRKTWDTLFGNAVYVTITSGMTYWGLAEKYGTTVSAIGKLNPGKNPLALQIGDTVRVK